MMPNAFATVAIWLGAGWLRAWEVPLNAAYRGPLLARLTTHAGARVVIADARFAERFAEVADQLPGVEHLVVVGAAPGPAPAAASWTVHAAGALLAAAAPATGVEEPKPWDVATILHTSGTTGMSKGVLNPWAQVHATAFGNIPRDRLGPEDVWYSPLPLFHIGGKLVVYAMAITNGRVVLRERFSTSAFWDDVRRFGATATILIGTTAAFIGGLPERAEDADNPLKFLQMAPLPPDPEAWKRRYGVEVFSSYNMTEISCAIWTQGATPDPRTCGRVRDGYELSLIHI